MAKFHKFYETVAEAKIIYLNGSVKEERLNFAEINCDAVEFDDDIASIKVEPAIDAGAIHLEQTEHKYVATNTSQRHNDVGPLSSNLFDFANDDASSDSDKCMAKFDEEHHVPKVEESAAIPSAEISAKVEHTHDASVNPSTAPNRTFDHLISKYMDMHCELCRHPFRTLSEASSHYRSQHQRRTATLKCCQRRIQVPDIRDHIQYHLNPNLFK